MAAGGRVPDRLLVQRHGQAPGHAADELAARGQRVDDPARGEDAEHPPHPDLAGGHVHRDLGELGAEGVPFLLGERRRSASAVSDRAVIPSGGMPAAEGQLLPQLARRAR